MGEWYDADYVMKKYNEQIDHEYMYGSNSIHAKYSAFIAERERKLKAEDEAYARMMKERAERKARLEAEQSERMC